MILTGAFFADAASVADGKFYVLGGGWDTIQTSTAEGALTSFVLVTMVQLDPADKGVGSIEVRLVDPDGKDVGALNGAVQVDGHREQVPLITALNIHFPRAGRHVVVVEAGSGQAISLALNVRSKA